MFVTSGNKSSFMKIGLLSDIHGNFKAFEAVLDDMAAENVDHIICLGDVATLGPQPRQVIKKLRVLKVDCIMGNHDEALSNIENLENYRIPSILSSTMKWCRHLLNDEEMEFISKFKKNIDIPLNDDESLIAYHGSINSNTVGVLPETSDKEAEDLISQRKAVIMVGGHTHLQMDRVINGTRIVSTGSVGCPFVSTPVFGEEPDLLKVAQYGLVDYSDGKINVLLKSIQYDIESYLRVLKDSDLPSKEWWLKQLS